MQGAHKCADGGLGPGVSVAASRAADSASIAAAVACGGIACSVFYLYIRDGAECDASDSLPTLVIGAVAAVLSYIAVWIGRRGVGETLGARAAGYSDVADADTIRVVKDDEAVSVQLVHDQKESNLRWHRVDILDDKFTRQRCEQWLALAQPAGGDGVNISNASPEEKTEYEQRLREVTAFANKRTCPSSDPLRRSGSCAYDTTVRINVVSHAMQLFAGAVHWGTPSAHAFLNDVMVSPLSTSRLCEIFELLGPFAKRVGDAEAWNGLSRGVQLKLVQLCTLWAPQNTSFKLQLQCGSELSWLVTSPLPLRWLPPKDEDEINEYYFYAFAKNSAMLTDETGAAWYNAPSNMRDYAMEAWGVTEPSTIVEWKEAVSRLRRLTPVTAIYEQIQKINKGDPVNHWQMAIDHLTPQICTTSEEITSELRSLGIELKKTDTPRLSCRTVEDLIRRLNLKKMDDCTLDWRRLPQGLISWVEESALNENVAATQLFNTAVAHCATPQDAVSLHPLAIEGAPMLNPLHAWPLMDEPVLYKRHVWFVTRFPTGTDDTYEIMHVLVCLNPGMKEVVVDDKWVESTLHGVRRRRAGAEDDGFDLFYKTEQVPLEQIQPLNAAQDLVDPQVGSDITRGIVFEVTRGAITGVDGVTMYIGDNPNPLDGYINAQIRKKAAYSSESEYFTLAGVSGAVPQSARRIDPTVAMKKYLQLDDHVLAEYDRLWQSYDISGTASLESLPLQMWSDSKLARLSRFNHDDDARKATQAIIIGLKLLPSLRPDIEDYVNQQKTLKLDRRERKVLGALPDEIQEEQDTPHIDVENVRRLQRCADDHVRVKYRGYAAYEDSGLAVGAARKLAEDTF